MATTVESRRRSLALQAVCTLGLVLVLVFPAALALYVGEVPYQELIRPYPGAGVSVTTTVLQSIAEVSSVVSIGALVHVLFLRPLSGERPSPSRQAPTSPSSGGRARPGRSAPSRSFP